MRLLGLPSRELGESVCASAANNGAGAPQPPTASKKRALDASTPRAEWSLFVRIGPPSRNRGDPACAGAVNNGAGGPQPPTASKKRALDVSTPRAEWSLFARLGPPSRNLGNPACAGAVNSGAGGPRPRTASKKRAPKWRILDAVVKKTSLGTPPPPPRHLRVGRAARHRPFLSKY